MRYRASRWLLASLILLLGAAQMQAQWPDPPPRPGPDRFDRVRQRVETLRIWKLTDALTLETETATLFLPRYRAYLTRHDSLEQQLHQVFRRIVAGRDGDQSQPAPQELIDRARKLTNERALAIFDLAEQSADLLDPDQRAALIVFEYRFSRELRDILRNMREERLAPPTPPKGLPGRR